MFVTETMRYIQLIVLEKDFNKVLDILAGFGGIEIKKEIEDKTKITLMNDKLKSNNDILNQIEEKINVISDFLGISKTNTNGNLKEIEDIQKYFDSLYKKLENQRNDYCILTEKLNDIQNTLKELEQYKNLNITKKELENLEFMYSTIVAISEEDLVEIYKKMGGRLLYFKINKNLFVLFTSKKGRFSLESDLKKKEFKVKNPSFEDNISPDQLYNKLNSEIKKINEKINKLNLFKKEILNSELQHIYEYMESYNLQKIYHEIYQITSHSTMTAIIQGWIVKSNLKGLSSKFHEEFQNKVSIIVYNPEELEDVKNGKVKVPVVMKNPKILKPFEDLVFNYGAPPYKSIDPTFFVATTFILLFGFMFGDIGQGFCILLIGTLLRLSNNVKLKKYKSLSPIFQYAGIIAIIFGCLYGSIFCFEHIETIFTPINKMLFNIDRPFIIDNSLSKIMNIVILVLTIGLLINLMGIIINIINNFFHKDYEEAFFSRNGFAGLIIITSVLILFLEFAFFKIGLSIIFFYLILASFVLILIKEPVGSILKKEKKIFHKGFGFWLIISLVELLETIMLTISNNFSFIRVAAFAATHVILSKIIIDISNMMGYLGIIMIVFGNAIIICMEGLIVGIQTIRLEYYEFFSKFFIKRGRLFMPFKIDRKKII